MHRWRGGGGLKNFKVGLCCWDPGTLTRGTFHSKKIPLHSSCTDPTQTPAHFVIVLVLGGYKRAVLGTTILSNGKGHFGPTEQDNWTGQSGPPSKLVPNIPVGPNRNGLFQPTKISGILG